jgi:hypothetical protein
VRGLPFNACFYSHLYIYQINLYIYLKCVGLGRKLVFRKYEVWRELCFLTGGAGTFSAAFSWADPIPVQLALYLCSCLRLAWVLTSSLLESLSLERKSTRLHHPSLTAGVVGTPVTANIRRVLLEEPTEINKKFTLLSPNIATTWATLT